MMISYIFLAWLLVGVSGQFPYGRQNPAILHDARQTSEDGSYQFQYSTQDGISHFSQSRPDRVIEGAFGYTDPTGLKVNHHYSTGTVKKPTQPDPFRRPHTNRHYYDYEDYDDGSYRPRASRPRLPKGQQQRYDY